MSSLSVQLTIHLLSICHSLSLVSHRLYDLTPAPYLHKYQYKLPQYLGYLDKPVNVYRDTNDITDQTELTDAIRTQDQDRLVSAFLLILIRDHQSWDYTEDQKTFYHNLCHIACKDERDLKRKNTKFGD